MARMRPGRAPVLAFDALAVEGALISPAMLARIAAHQAPNQAEADYGVPKGLTLRDEIARYFRIGQALFAELTAGEKASAGATTKFVEDLLRDVFGFADLKRVGSRTLGDRHFAVTLEGSGGRVPIVVVPPAEELDRPSDHLPTDGRRGSAASAIQDWLNASEASLWGFCCNGFRLRLVRDNESLTRPAYIEADLRAIFQEEDFADFTALWFLAHASRFGWPGTPLYDCALERWREAGQKEGVAARDRLRDGVEAALLSFGNGFLAHPENTAIREKLRSHELSLPDFFGQLLRLVYRLIFLLAAEDRDLLHPPGTSAAARRLYADGYSLAALRDGAARRAAWDRHHDRWEGLLITFMALASGEKRLGLPALDGLFASGTLADLENAKLANRSLMEAIWRLAWLKDDSGLVPVNWRDMETEELGSVYESLLELTPQLNGDGRQLRFAEAGEAKGHARKTTGSYYTPDSLVQALLDSALDPVLDRIEAEADDPAAALLSVTVLDPACGSGHFLLAAARRIATRLARARTHGVPSPTEFRYAMREVARACTHGVDRNPMAVELTKVALWIETVEPGKPLGFLDANIRCGDSLFGLFDLKVLAQGIPDAAYKPLVGDDRDTAKHFAKRNKAERVGQGSLDFSGGSGRLPGAAPLATQAKAMRAMPEDSPEEIALKRERFEAARAEARGWNLLIAADLYVAAFLTPKTGGVPVNRNTVTIPTTAAVWDALAGRTVYGPLVGRAQDLAGTARAFHWPLEFPDVMAAGGFDVVLGNPPWERIKVQEHEFFASRDPEIGEAPNAKVRAALIAKLKSAAEGSRERDLYTQFERARRSAEASSALALLPAVAGGRFPLSGRGDVNTYALFSELFVILIRPEGRAGIIVPTGIATDALTAPFFAALVAGRQLASLIDFENRERIFPAIDSRMKFSLLTVGNNVPQAAFAFFLTDPAQLAEPQRNFTLSPQQIAAINPNTKTAPIFRSRADAELTAKIYSRVPVLIDETKGKDGNPWGVTHASTFFDMTRDVSRFSATSELEEQGFVVEGNNWVSGNAPGLQFLPLFEAKMLHLFDHRWVSFVGSEGDSREVSVEQKRDPSYEPLPRYWVARAEIGDRLKRQMWDKIWLIGLRKITNATNERTIIATLFPLGAVGNSEHILFPSTRISVGKMVLFVGAASSLVLDYVARQKIGGTNLNFFYVEQLPFPSPEDIGETEVAFAAPRVLELTYTSHSMAPLARDLGYDGPPFKWDEDRRAQLRAELDAFYARAYGLTREELRYILDPAEVRGPNYPSETFRVLKKNEIAKYGEYRTARLVLAAYDELAVQALTAE
jgi:hypothetical protein